MIKRNIFLMTLLSSFVISCSLSIPNNTTNKKDNLAIYDEIHLLIKNIVLRQVLMIHSTQRLIEEIIFNLLLIPQILLMNLVVL